MLDEFSIRLTFTGTKHSITLAANGVSQTFVLDTTPICCGIERLGTRCMMIVC